MATDADDSTVDRIVEMSQRTCHVEETFDDHVDLEMRWQRDE